MEDNNSEELHKFIMSDEKQLVEDWLIKYLSKFPYDKHVLNSSNESAVFTALSNKRIEMYDLLLGKEQRLAPHEDFSEIILGMSCMMKKQLRSVQNKHVQNPNIDYYNTLIRKSRTSPEIILSESKKIFHLKRISQAFEELMETEEIVPIMKVVSLSKLRIIFDLKRESTNIMAPGTSRRSQGVTFYTEGTIYVSAKDLKETESPSKHVCGVLAHELCHYAMQLVYNNNCKPYFKDNETQKKEFEKVFDQCSERRNDEELIQVVFDEYKANERHAELIVRVPHILAMYRSVGNKVSSLRETYNTLFDYYNKVLADLSKEYPIMDSKNKVRNMNEIFGLFEELDRSEPKIMFRPQYLNLIKENQTYACIQSNCPELTMKAIRQQLNNDVKSDSFCMITTWKLLENPRNREKTKEALESTIKPLLIVDCSEKSLEGISSLMKFFGNSQIQRIVYVLPINGQNENAIDHQWNHLTDESLIHLLEREIDFQGTTLPLGKLLPIDSDALQLLPLKSLLFGKIKVGETIGRVETIERSFKSDAMPRLNASEFIEEAEKLNVVVLSNDPGMGKTTEWKKMAQRIKAKRSENWVFFMDLKNYVEAFNKKDIEKDLNSKEEVAEYFCGEILKIKDFEAKVFLQLFIDGRVVLLTDALDEISPNYKNAFLKLVAKVSTLSENHILIATRPHMLEDLELQLGKTFIFRLLPFDKTDRDKFLRVQFEMKNMTGEDLEKAMKDITKLSHSLGDLYNPLHLRMLAEVIGERETKNFVNSDHLNIFSLYQTFKEKAMSICLEEKGPEAKRENLRQITDTDPKPFMKNLQKIALKQICCNGRGDEDSVVNLLQGFQNLAEMDNEELTRVSLVTMGPSKKIEFLHRTFAEFFVAEYVFSSIFSANIKLQNMKTIFTHIWTGDYNKDNKMVTTFVNDAIKLKYDKLQDSPDSLMKLKQRLEMLIKKIDLAEETRMWIRVQILCLFFVEKRKPFYELIMTVRFITVFSKKWDIFGHFAEFCLPEIFEEIISFAIKYQDQKVVEEFLSIESMFSRDILTRAMHNIEHKDMFEKILHNQQIQSIMKDEGWRKIFSFSNAECKDFLVVVAATRHFLILLKWVYEKWKSSGLINFLKNSGGLNHVGYYINFSGYDEVKECCHWLRDKLTRSEFHDCIISASLGVTKFGIQYNVSVTHFEGFFENDEEKKRFLLRENKNGWTAFHYEFSTWVQKNSFGSVINTYERWCGRDEMKNLLMKKIIHSHEMNILHLAVISKNSEYCNLKLLWNYMTKLLGKESMKALLIERNDKGETFFPALKEKLHLISRDSEEYSAFVEDTLRFYDQFIRNTFSDSEIIEIGFTHDIFSNDFISDSGNSKRTRLF